MRDGKILIVTTPVDPEAIVLAAAAAMRGIECQIWNTNEFPSEARHTFSVANNDCAMEMLDGAGRPIDVDFSSVWLREICAPEIYSEKIDPRDKEYIDLLSRKYYEQLFEFIKVGSERDNSFWINEIGAAKRAESKIAQLSAAVESGFDVPATIISNDIAKIVEFAEQFADVRLIRKSVYPYQWEEDGRLFSNKTSFMDLTQIDDMETLSFHPEIFQAYVDKHSEVRCVFFGDTSFSVIVEPGDERHRTVDWRIYHAHGLGKARAFSLPDEVAERCRDCMSRLGIVSGSFDLFIDGSGRYVFGEVNQGGLFFWMERLGLPVIDAFLEFCLHKDASFTYRGTGSVLIDNVLSSNEYSVLESDRKLRQARRNRR